MICSKCNRKLSDDSKFCQYCGNKISSVKEETIAKYNTVNNVDADNATKNVSLEVESEHTFANSTQALVDTYTQAHALYKTKNVEKIQCAIRLFKEIEDLVDVSTEIQNCAAKIEKIKKSQFAKIEKIKDIESQPVISQVANKAVLIVGIPIVLTALFWIVLSFLIPLELIHFRRSELLSLIVREYRGCLYCAVAQFITVGIVFTLLLISSKRTHVFVTVPRILLSALNLVMACLSPANFESLAPFASYLGKYSFCVKFAPICYIANIILSVLFIILIIMGAFRKKPLT